MSTLRMALETFLDIHQPQNRSISVLLTDDESIRELNRDWRQIDEPTDVLSWEGGDFPGAPLGDLAISLDTAERQARVRGVALHAEVALLGIHGALHLIGYDDLTDNDRKEMLVKMREVASVAGIAMEEEWSSMPHSPEGNGR